MSCDVYIYRLNKIQLLNTFTRVNADAAVISINFNAFVENRNTEYKRPCSFINHSVVTEKIKTDANRLNRDELWEIIEWVYYVATDGYSNEDDEALIRSTYEDFGFYLLQEFRNNTRTFLFPLADFLTDVYNDFAGEERDGRNLSPAEFFRFLDYLEYLYSLILYYESNSLELEAGQLTIVINKFSTDLTLKSVVENRAAIFRATRKESADGPVFDNYSNRAIHLGDLEQILQLCQELRQCRFTEHDNLLILDSQ